MNSESSRQAKNEQASAVAPEEKKLTSTSEVENGTTYAVAPDSNSREKQIQSILKVIKSKDFIIGLFSLVLVIIGIALLANPNVSIITKEYREDYTDCTEFSFDSDGTKTCKQLQLEKYEPCICSILFNITEELDGKLDIYYELETFDQSKIDYTKSRDDNQLKGELAEIPSENCEPYRYDTVLGQQKPIYPCGAIADSMFNDTYDLIYITTRDKVVLINSGLLTDADKLGYRNPDKAALQNFTRPKNWAKSIWDLNTNSEENNGVQDERFIGWMNTELKRKPYARVNQTRTVFENGFKVGEYGLRIGYNYPAIRYSGRRIFIISASVATTTVTNTVIGILVLLVGLILLAKIVATFVINKYVKTKDNERPASGENLSNNQ